MPERAKRIEPGHDTRRTPYGSILLALCCLTSGCVMGSRTTLGIGPTFGAHETVGFALVLEHGVIAHREGGRADSATSPAAAPTAEPTGDAAATPDAEQARAMRELALRSAPIGSNRYEPNAMGIAFVAALAGGWQGAGTANDGRPVPARPDAVLVAGLDYVPYLFEGVHVSLGMLLGGSLTTEGRGIVAAVPRVAFAVTPWSWGAARLGLGMRLECSFVVHGEGPRRCGPMLTVTRIAL